MTEPLRIGMLEGAPAVLPPFAPMLQDHARRQLEAMGVEVRTNSLPADMGHESATVNGPDGLETICARTHVWAATLPGAASITAADSGHAVMATR
jgi:NADH dehydrogenase